MEAGMESKKTKGSRSKPLATLGDAIDLQPQLKKGLKRIAHSRGDILARGTHFLKTHWKTVFPAMALVGAGAVLLTARSKR